MLEIPDRVVEGYFQDNIVWFKDFFRNSPEKNLFPKIGWENAFQLSSLLFLKAPGNNGWMESNEYLIKDGKSSPLSSVVLLFLNDYVENDKRNENRFEYLAISYIVNRLLYLDTYIAHIDDFFELRRILNGILTAQWPSSPETFFKQLISIDDSAVTHFVSTLRQTWRVIQKGKKVAIENNDESQVGFFMNSEKDFLIKYGFLERIFK